MIATVVSYSGALRVLHWGIAALVFMIWPLGLMIGFAKQEVQLSFYMVHESLGFLVLWLMLARIGARLTSDAPALQGPLVERTAARLVHGALYAFLVIMPVSGFLATNAHGFPLVWFGLVPVWSPLGKTPDIAWTLSGIHEASAWTLLALVALHIGAALFHHVIRRDNTLFRIL